jgi:hypothetical protein
MSKIFRVQASGPHEKRGTGKGEGRKWGEEGRGGEELVPTTFQTKVTFLTYLTLGAGVQECDIELRNRITEWSKILNLKFKVV